jgi:hypothetical protein
MRKILSAVTLSLLLGACSHTVQTTSGTDYLNNYSTAPQLLAAMDPQVKAAAEVEPVLTFPARLGLARIVDGRLSPIPDNEARLWADFAAANEDLGEFVPVSPLLAAFAIADTKDAAPSVPVDCGSYVCTQSPVEIVQAIRIGAARQHVDAVLIYEVGASGNNELNPLAIGDLLLVGLAVLPGRDLEARGLAQAILIDVRNGYPYGTAAAAADISRLHPTMGSDAKLEAMRRDVAAAVVAQLIPEVQAMVAELKAGLAGTSAAKQAMAN